MMLRRDGVRMEAVLIHVKETPMLLLAGAALVELSDPMLRHYRLELATPAEIAQLRSSGFNIKTIEDWLREVFPAPSPDDDPPSD